MADHKNQQIKELKWSIYHALLNPSQMNPYNLTKKSQLKKCYFLIIEWEWQNLNVILYVISVTLIKHTCLSVSLSTYRWTYFWFTMQGFILVNGRLLDRFKGLILSLCYVNCPILKMWDWFMKWNKKHIGDGKSYFTILLLLIISSSLSFTVGSQPLHPGPQASNFERLFLGFYLWNVEHRS